MWGELRCQLESRLGLCAFLSLALGLSCGGTPWHLVGVGALLLMVRRRAAVGVVVGFALLGIWLRPIEPKVDFDRKPFRGVVQVVSVPVETENGQSATVALGGRRYRLFVPLGLRLNLGDVVEMAGSQEPPAESRAGSRGVVAVLRPIGGVRYLWRGPDVFGWGVAVRQSFVTFANSSLSPRGAAMVDALCMGADYAIDDGLWDALKRTGTVHVVVASGLQAMIAAAGALALLGRTGLRREYRLLAVLLFLFVYSAAAGFRPPVLRAAVMATLGYTHYLFGRQSDGLNSLGVACALALGLDPWQVYDVGLWLSATAVAGLAMYADFDGAWRTELGGWWKELARTNWVASLATAPVTAWALGQVSLVGIGLNLLVVPVAEAVLGGALLAWLVWLVLPPVGTLLLQTTVGPLVDRLVTTVEWVAGWPWACVYFGWFSPYWLALVYVGAVLAWRPRRRDAA